MTLAITPFIYKFIEQSLLLEMNSLSLGSFAPELCPLTNRDCGDIGFIRRGNRFIILSIESCKPHATQRDIIAPA